MIHVEMKACILFLLSFGSTIRIGYSSLTWYQSINVFVCVKSTETDINQCRTCVPCPDEDVYGILKEACPYGAADDCLYLCNMYKEHTTYAYIESHAKNLNDFARCHFNTVELKNVSITSTSTASKSLSVSPSSASTATPTLRGITANTKINSPPMKEWRLSFGEIMLTVICIAIFVLIVGALCRSGFRKRKEELKKKRQNEVEAQRMSVLIQTGDALPIRKMSVGPSEEPNAGFLCGIFPRFQPKNVPETGTIQDRAMPEPPAEFTGEGSNNVSHGAPGRLPPPVQINFHGNTNLFDVKKSLDDLVSNVLSQTKDLPNEIVYWKRVFKEKRVLKYFCDIDPVHLLDYMPNILTEEQEQWVKQIKEREGSIRACKRLLIFVLSSKNLEWPRILNTALEEAGYPNQAKLLQNSYNTMSKRTSAESNLHHEPHSEHHVSHSSELGNEMNGVFTEKITTV